jgi:hypothetical protein
VKDPYRNERVGLRTEVERLRAELARARRPRRRWRLFALGLLAHVALRLALAPWLNGASDALFWAAAFAAFAPLALGVAALWRGPAPPPPPKETPPRD